MVYRLSSGLIIEAFDVQSYRTHNCRSGRTRVSLYGQTVRMGSMDHVNVPIVVRNATAGDVASMQAVQVEALQRFREIDDPRIARSTDDTPYWTEGLTRAATDQRAWVAIDDLGAVIGFAVAWVLDGEGHLDELAVVPAHGRRGVGRALVDEVLAWTAARGLPSVTLITFATSLGTARTTRIGFEAVTALTPELQGALDQGETWGVDAI